MKNDAKYTSNNEIWIYTVGFFGLVLLTFCKFHKNKLSVYLIDVVTIVFIRRLAKLNLVKVSNTKTNHVLIYIYIYIYIYI